MKIPNQVHRDRPWRVHGFVTDFKLLDVWRMPVTGGPGDTLADFEKTMENVERALMNSGPAGMLFRLRIGVGRLLKWDVSEKRRAIPGAEEASLRGRISPQLAATVVELDSASGVEFSDVYRLDDEVVRELSNETVHAVMHTGKVPLDDGNWGIEMAVYAKTRGLTGRGYMAAIEPFRAWIVYPTLMRRVGKAWAARNAYAAR